MIQAIIKKIKAAPKDPGVYIFRNGKQPLYIGKASNLKNRLQNYLQITDIKTKSLHREANRLRLIKLNSNIEALIVESQLIKKLKPKYNVLFKDDKNYFYVAVTKEKFPRIFITHQPQKAKSEERGAKSKSLSTPQYIGPFTDGRAIKTVLRLLRRHFPYCTCKNPHLRSCLNSQIGNCPGYCCNITDNRQLTNDNRLLYQYKKNISKIKNILTGKDKRFIKQLKDPYELLVLEKIWAHSPFLTGTEGKSEKREANNKRQLFTHRFPLSAQTVECYDNSHLSGKEAVGALTAWQLKRPQTHADTTQNNAEIIKFNNSQHTVRETREWVANKNMWRKFKIRGNYTEDDPRMMEEIVSRRLNHPEWPYPDLIIIDGGITQFNAAKRALQKRIKNNELGIMGKNKSLIHNSKFIIPKIISFAKPQQLVFGLEKNPVPISRLPEEFQKLIKMTIQNTHNFVIRYHRKIRERTVRI